MRKTLDLINQILKNERGTIRKEHGGKLRICLIYPNTYRVGIANLGFQSVYRLFNQRKDVVCERAFAPDEGLIPEFEKGHPLVSLESRLPINQFDVLAFSLAFENDLPNLIKILKLSRIRILAKERGFRDPFLIAGGALCFANPEPFAEIFDCIFVGEAEELIDPFVDCYLRTKRESQSSEFKEILKRELIKLPGLYIPDAYRQITDSEGRYIGKEPLWHEAPKVIKKVSSNNLKERFNFSQIVTPLSAFPEMFLIETMRGCPFNCRFCLVGKIYRPVRKVPLENLRHAIEEARKYEPKVVGLIAPSLSAHRELVELLESPEIELSFTSLRADRLTLSMIDHLSRRKTVTLAPEAGTERLRRIIGKEISEENILEVVRALNDRGVERVKLYFMIGLPFETEEDIEGIVKLLRLIREVFHRKLTVSVSIFVPKPFTPFQWHSMERLEIVKEKLKKLNKDTLKLKGINLVHEVPKYSYLQGYLSRADRRALNLLERLSSGVSVQNIIESQFEELYTPKSFEQNLPWDFIVHDGLSKEILWKDYENAKSLAALSTPSKA